MQGKIALIIVRQVSGDGCSNTIKQACGMTFTELVAGARMQRASMLLLITQLGVSDVAYAVGYKSPETFIRAFERAFGCTPNQYRREASGSANH